MKLQTRHSFWLTLTWSKASSVTHPFWYCDRCTGNNLRERAWAEGQVAKDEQRFLVLSAFLEKLRFRDKRSNYNIGKLPDFILIWRNRGIPTKKPYLSLMNPSSYSNGWPLYQPTLYRPGISLALTHHHNFERSWTYNICKMQL